MSYSKVWELDTRAFRRRSATASQSTRVLCTLGRYDEAEPLALLGDELGDPADVMTQQTWRQVQALVHSARGEHTEAERLAREAVDFALRSDSRLGQGGAFFDLGKVLSAAGKSDEATAALAYALGCYERKGNLPDAARVRALLEQLEDASRA